MRLHLTSGGRTAMWIGCGGFVGLAVGGLLTNPDRAFSLLPTWLVGLAVYVGLVIGLARDKAAMAAARPPPAAAAAPAAARPKVGPRAQLTPSARDGLQVRFELPDIPPGYPAVLGRGEALHVTIRVSKGSAPSEGAGVQLAASKDDDTLTADGITGEGGVVEFTLEPEGTGELTLGADAKVGALEGHASAIVSLVNYDEEIERLFSEFRAYAVGALGPEAHADTARELCDKLRARADAKTARALLELARVYELVAYGERDADRRLYLAVLEQLMVLEHAELSIGGDHAVTREA